MAKKVVFLSEHQVRRVKCNNCGCSKLHIDIDETEERAHMSCSKCGAVWQDGEAISPN